MSPSQDVRAMWKVKKKKDKREESFVLNISYRV